MSLTKEKMIDLYATMKKIRLFEEKVSELFAEGKLPGFVVITSHRPTAAMATASPRGSK
jgi:pyruvate dehydrogenase E1 component alpha subunit